MADPSPFPDSKLLQPNQQLRRSRLRRWKIGLRKWWHWTVKKDTYIVPFVPVGEQDQPKGEPR